MLARRLWNRLFTFADDRGHRYSVFAPIRAHRAHTGRRAPAIAGKALGSLYVVLILLPGLLFLGSAVRSGDAALVRMAVWVTLGAMGVLAAMGMVMLLVTRWEGSWRRPNLVRAHICARCGYALAGLPPQEDGCTQCPECPAAWRLTPPPRRYGAVGPAPAFETPRGPLHAARQRWRRFASFADARGTRWPVGAPSLVLTRRLSPGQRTMRIVGALAVGILLILLIPAFLAAATALLLAPLIAAGVPSDHLVRPVMFLVAFPLGVFLVVVVSVRRERRRMPARLGECLADGLCAVCGRPLSELPSDADGCTECPDCGAAWKTEQIGQGAHAPAPAQPAHAP